MPLTANDRLIQAKTRFRRYFRIGHPELNQYLQEALSRYLTGDTTPRVKAPFKTLPQFANDYNYSTAKFYQLLWSYGRLRRLVRDDNAVWILTRFSDFAGYQIVPRGEDYSFEIVVSELIMERWLAQGRGEDHDNN